MTRIFYATTYGSTREYPEELARCLGCTAEFLDDVDLGQRPLAAVAVGMSLPEAARRRDQMRNMPGSSADQVERFYLQGRLNYSELSARHHGMMQTISTMLRMKPGKTANERAMVEPHNRDVDLVDFTQLDPIVEWALAHGA